MQETMIPPNRLVHFDTFDVYFWKRISKNFLIFSWVGVFLTVIYIPFDYQLHGQSEDFVYILMGRFVTFIFAVLVVIATAHPWFEHKNVLGITTFGTMGFSAVTITYLFFGNPIHIVVYAWFFYLLATIMMVPLITKKIFFIMEGYQVAFMLYVMHLTQQKEEEIAIFISLAIPLLGYIFAVVWLGRKNGLEAYANARQNHFLMSLDGLSHLLNRRTWYESAHRLWKNDKGLSFVMLDIDYFKKINDTYGHECGDMVITRVSQVLLDETREYDVIGRLGGEEFGILLPQTTLHEASAIAERIRSRVESLEMRYENSLFYITISSGVVSNQDSIQDLNSFVVLGDKCLYEAKATGRNRVVSYDTL